jgi:radical SAM protein with 4Fe4S-binding SPASM domain
MKDKYPYVKENFYFRPGPVPYIYSKNENIYYKLNKDASDIVVKCNGNMTINKMAYELSNSHNENMADLNKTIIRYINSQKFIGLSNEKKIISDKYWVNPDIQTPVHLSLELTDNCNFMCKHCYRDSDSRQDHYAKTDELIAILKEFRRNGVAILELTGGEPFRHPDFEKILTFALETFDIVAVITNGSLITYEFLNRMEKYKEKIVFQVGLHSTDQEYMDWFCGFKGAFKKSKEVIKQLTDEKFNLRVVMMVTPLNVNHIFETVKLASSLGVPFKPIEYNYNLGLYTIGISPVSPMGRGENFPELIFNQANLNIFIEEMESVKKEFGDFIFKMPEHLPMQDLSKRGNCGVGSRSLTIAPSGDLKLCGMSNEKLLNLGNIYEEDLSKIFDRNLGAIIGEIPTPDKNYCEDCKHLTFCMPCLARAFMKYDEIGDACNWAMKLNLKEKLNI